MSEQQQATVVRSNHHHRINRLYAVLSGDDQTERLCEAIPDNACAEVPGNYLINVLNGLFSKLAERLAGADMVLAWILTAIGAPAAAIGALKPLRMAGATLPQLAVAAQIRRYPLRKRFWTGAGLVQAAALWLVIPAVWFLPGETAGWTVVALMTLFALASGVGSVAFQDVVGKTIPRGRRGRLLAVRSTLGGIFALGAGIWLYGKLGTESDLMIYLALVGLGGAFWALAALAFALTREVPGATEGGRNALSEAGHGWRIVVEHAGYRWYLLARAALLAVEVATPLYILHGHGFLAWDAATLGLFVASAAFAQIIGSPFWGRFADTSARMVMAWSGLIGVAAGGLALLVPLVPEPAAHVWLYSLVFVLLGLAESGIRLGRKTWVVDAAPAGERPTWVAFGNTVVGILTLATIGFGVLAARFGSDAVIVALMALSVLGTLFSLAMTDPGD